ncbi:hypothetical protein ILYODFUR_012117 [Ilyodon furcidens]|uniref:Uncharacterized protein n=1 Tax=Ilyodon furcidens TaxID=33524 RepID=A0ABV0SZZ5_9TELE
MTKCIQHMTDTGNQPIVSLMFSVSDASDRLMMGVSGHILSDNHSFLPGRKKTSLSEVCAKPLTPEEKPFSTAVRVFTPLSHEKLQGPNEDTVKDTANLTNISPWTAS